MYILQQSDLSTFNSIKQNHLVELADGYCDVVPIPNGDGTYNLDYDFFADAAQNFLNDLISQNFFTNLATQ